MSDKLNQEDRSELRLWIDPSTLIACRHENWPPFIYAYMAVSEHERLLAAEKAKAARLVEALEYYAKPRKELRFPLANGTDIEISGLHGGPWHAEQALAEYHKS